MSVFVVGLGASTFYLYQQTNNIYELNQFNRKLNQDSSALILLANERLLYDSERFYSQLDQASNNLKRSLLNSHGLVSESDRQILSVYLADIRFLLQRYHQDTQSGLNEKLRKSAYYGVMSKIYGLNSELNRITASAQEKFKQQSQVFITVLAIILVVFLLLPSIGLKQLRSQLGGALQRVSRSMSQMVDQRFETSVHETQLQEVNQIVSALNQLRFRLLAEMASREELEQEMERRNKAELEARELLETLQLNQKKMIQMEKLSSMGTMVGGVAHELNNPLMGILNYIQYSQKRCQNDKAKDVLQRAQDEVYRIQSLVQNMLVFSRSQNEVELQALELESVLNQVLMLLEGSFKKLQIDVTVELPSHLKVLANEDLLKQVLVNLLTNARDAMQSVDTPKLHISWAQQVLDEGIPQNVISGLKVVDNGHGIPESIKHQIFDPFFTTKPAGQGTGLGLSISKEMAEKMQAELLLLDSDFGKTSFFLKLRALYE